MVFREYMRYFFIQFLTLVPALDFDYSWECTRRVIYPRPFEKKKLEGWAERMKESHRRHRSKVYHVTEFDLWVHICVSRRHHLNLHQLPHKSSLTMLMMFDTIHLFIHAALQLRSKSLRVSNCTRNFPVPVCLLGVCDRISSEGTNPGRDKLSTLHLIAFHIHNLSASLRHCFG